MTESLPIYAQVRPRVSVCMATYNGERFVTLQLRSILSQINDDDEIIIVDDASQDGTRAQIAAIQDPRILLFENQTNRGVLQTFAEALSRATGEIIFLSDQDDLWLPGKVDTVLTAFSKDSDLMLVASDAVLIDDQGHRIGASYYATRGKFRAGLCSNLLICKFLGCTMAFRSALARKALPFPKTFQVHHDLWIGCVNALNQGKVLYIPDPLVEYRRHSANITGRVRFSTSRRLQMRLQLYAALLRYYVRPGEKTN